MYSILCYVTMQASDRVLVTFNLFPFPGHYPRVFPDQHESSSFINELIRKNLKFSTLNISSNNVREHSKSSQARSMIKLFVYYYNASICKRKLNSGFFNGRSDVSEMTFSWFTFHFFLVHSYEKEIERKPRNFGDQSATLHKYKILAVNKFVLLKRSFNQQTATQITRLVAHRS